GPQAAARSFRARPALGARRRRVGSRGGRQPGSHGRHRRRRRLLRALRDRGAAWAARRLARGAGARQTAFVLRALAELPGAAERAGEGGEVSERKNPPPPKRPSIDRAVPGAGRSGRPSSIGPELGTLDDFEPEELFDSILNEETSGAGGGAERGEGAAEPETARPPKPAGAAPTGPKLHEPEQRSYPAEEETLVGGRGPASTDATELLPLMGSSWDDDLPGSSDAVDQLLHSTAPSATPPAKPIAPPPPRAAKPPAPRPAGSRAPATVPRPASPPSRPPPAPPRPALPPGPRPAGSRAPVTVPRPASLPSRTRPAPTGTALPPPVNPAGPPPRQPFPLAGTPAPGGTRYDEDDETIRYTDRPSAPDPATTP